MKRFLIFFLACSLALAGCTPKTGADPLANPKSESIATPALSDPVNTAEIPAAGNNVEQPIEPVWSYPGSENWQMTGQVGGTTKALFREGDFLYLGSGLHVLVLDVTDPETIHVLGVSPLLPRFVESISSDGKGHLFVSCGSGGLAILNVSNPSVPTISGYLDTMGYTENAVSFGRYIVIADGPQGVQIADVSDIRNPVIVAEAYSLAYIYDVAIEGNTAYAAGGGSGLFTIDLSDPKQPVEAGLTQLNGCQYDAEIIAGRLYLAGAWGGVNVFDIGDPLVPTLASNMATTGWAMALANAGQDLLVLDGADGAMLCNIATEVPVYVSAFTLDGFVAAGISDGKTAFLLDEQYGLMVVDYTVRSEPELISRWMQLTEGRRVTLNGTTAYVAGGLSGMHVIDLSDWKQPLETYWYNSDGGYVSNVLVSGETAYVSSFMDTDEPLAVFDVSSPLSPIELGSMPNDEALFNAAFRSIALDGEVVYVAGEHAALSIDVRDSANPQIMSRIDSDIEPNSAAKSGNIFVTGGQLQIFDASDPRNLVLLSSMDNNTSGEAVTFLNDTTLLCAGEPGIWIVDLTDPANPVKTGELALSGSPMAIKMQGTTGYICAAGDGIYVVDFSDITNPTIIETIFTLGTANDCWIDGDRLLVADSTAGLTLYERGADADLTTQPDTSIKTMNLTLLTNEDISTNPYSAPEPMAAPDKSYEYVVNSTADAGSGTLRDALKHLETNTTITFDTSVFSPKNPGTILLESELPEINIDYLTIDASNAGVILDGSLLSEGNGLNIYSSHCKIMGMQILNFPGNGIQADGSWNQFGGSRAIGDGQIGQGNLLSGNGICGIVTGGWYTVVKGNLVGTDITGTKPYPNLDGIFVSDWGFYITVGSTNPDESNIASGNNFINMDTWGDHTLIIGNILGLDITGTKIVKNDTPNNLVIEVTAKNTTVGGTTLSERNIISGAQTGVVFSDMTSFQNSVIGNYIGTDMTGTKALGNNFGIAIWACCHHRIGGMAEGEGNLISGNQNAGAGLSGSGCFDNFIIGNRIGVDINGNPLPNGAGIDINTGQWHGTIGGYTQAEGNLVVGGSISMRITSRGIKDCYFAGNTVINPGNLMLYLENGVSDCFIQNNAFGETNDNAVRVDYGTGNIIRSNTFHGDKPWDLILLLEGGNNELAAPVTTSAEGSNIAGTTCAFGRVEVYLYEKTEIFSIGFTTADAKGSFTFESSELRAGKQIILLVTDLDNNTSVFSQPISIM